MGGEILLESLDLVALWVGVEDELERWLDALTHIRGVMSHAGQPKQPE